MLGCLFAVVLPLQVRVEPGLRSRLIVLVAGHRGRDAVAAAPADGGVAAAGDEVRLGHEDDRELETLRGVHRHQLHGVGAIEHRRTLARVEVVAALLEVLDDLAQRVARQRARDPHQLADVRARLLAALDGDPGRLDGGAVQRELEQRLRGRRTGRAPQLAEHAARVLAARALVPADRRRRIGERA